MAIACIAKPFSSRVFKLRLPHLFRWKARPAGPPLEAATPGRGNGNGDEGVIASRNEDEYRQVFRFLDANNDGRISAEELRAHFASVGESVSREEAERIIGEFSKGGEEDALLLGFEEFMRVMELRGSEDDARDVLRRAFEVYEEEKGSGCITPEGLRQVFRRLGEVKSVQECEAMIRVYDLDGNGVLDFHEFYTMMT